MLTSGGTLLYQTQPTYDAVDNIVGVSTTISGQTDLQQFCYDSFNRLTWSGTSGTPPCSGTNFSGGTLAAAAYQQSYSYNVDGGVASGPDGSYTYGNSSQPHTLASTSDGYSAAYDAAGNEICRSLSSATTCSGSSPTGQQLTYDAQGRLSSWQNQPSSTTSTANYLYDGSGHRVAMLTTVNGTTTLTTYIGGMEEVQTTGSSTQTTMYYTVAGRRVAANVNGTFYYFGYDALGSQVAVMNSNGNLIGAQLYSPYGNPRYSTGILPTSIGFTGQQTDSVTGLDYYVARYYDPVVSQFLSADIIQGNVEGIDPYSYVGGNTETRTDPSGQRYIDASGDYGDIGPGGSLDLFNPFPMMTSGGGYNENGNYAYHHWHYAPTVAHQPVSHGDPPQDNSGATWTLLLFLIDPIGGILSFLGNFFPGCNAMAVCEINMAAGGLTNYDLGQVNGFQWPSGQIHYDRHGADWGGDNSDMNNWTQYEAEARTFMSGKPGPNEYQIWNPTTHQFYRWNDVTRQFGIYDPTNGGRMVSYRDLGTGASAESKFARQFWADGQIGGQTTYVEGSPINPKLDDLPTMTSDPVIPGQSEPSEPSSGTLPDEP